MKTEKHQRAASEFNSFKLHRNKTKLITAVFLLLNNQPEFTELM